MKKYVFLGVMLAWLVGCTPAITSPTPTSLPSTASEAQEVLINFFDLLNSKQYAEADTLYGGDYEQLKIFNSDTDPAPSGHTKLWADACQLAGLQCLEVRSATFKNLQGDTYIFQVEFSNPDGSLFVLGPCCGANETEMPPISKFEYAVGRNTDHKYVVMNLPPYLP